ncbi:THUMP domain-containing class I SAM-dependent RNA methyltransferase, partial [Paenibacillus zanthoxyli]|uniref:THUMP domain-containing class I SAM-dependent RNA methyltransferase n=1 Tax=Paenibacillus zanthoxyli TaxID=369399 RepID=UPI000472624C
CCGSGTFLIEAAMMAWNIAPGLRRSFPSEHWPAIPPEAWQTAREEAFDAVRDDDPLQLTGSDIDPKAIEIAQAAAKSAGLSGEITFSVLPAAKSRPEGEYGCIITNPPYGERLSDDKEVEKLTRQFGQMMLHLPTWSFFAISPAKQFEHYFGRKADKRRKLYNGRIECQYYQYLGPLPPRAPKQETDAQ